MLESFAGRCLFVAGVQVTVAFVTPHIDPAVGCDPVSDWRLGWCVKDGLPLPTGSEAPSLLVHRLEVL